MLRCRYLAVALPIALVGVLLVLPAGALAHERRTIGGGTYDVVVGWDVEPAIERQKNAASIRVSRAGTNPAQPVEGLEKTLRVQIRQGAQTRELPLRAVFGQPGSYVADVVPTRAGQYQFRFTGTVEGTTVDEQFDSADGKFNGVDSSSALEFPVQTADPGAVASSLGTVQTLAYVGLGLGVLALVLSLVALRRRPSSNAPVRAEAPAREARAS